MIRFQKLTNGLCFSRTFLFSNTCDKTGTRVSVKINAPSSANPSVQARGENILPSTFSNAKMGNKAMMIIILEKKMAFPSSVPFFLMILPFASLLNLSTPTFSRK